MARSLTSMAVYELEAQTSEPHWASMSIDAPPRYVIPGELLNFPRKCSGRAEMSYWYIESKRPVKGKPILQGHSFALDHN